MPVWRDPSVMLQKMQRFSLEVVPRTHTVSMISTFLVRRHVQTVLGVFRVRVRVWEGVVVVMVMLLTNQRKRASLFAGWL